MGAWSVYLQRIKAKRNISRTKSFRLTTGIYQHSAPLLLMISSFTLLMDRALDLKTWARGVSIRGR